MSKRKLPVTIWKEGEWFVAKLVNIELASQGKTKKEALDNLKEAWELLIENENFKITSDTFPSKIELTQIYA